MPDDEYVIVRRGGGMNQKPLARLTGDDDPDELRALVSSETGIPLSELVCRRPWRRTSDADRLLALFDTFVSSDGPVDPEDLGSFCAIYRRLQSVDALSATDRKAADAFLRDQGVRQKIRPLVKFKPRRRRKS